LISIGLGVLKIPPSEFWQMSLKELYLAIDGHQEATGAKAEQPLRKAELEELMLRYPD